MVNFMSELNKTMEFVDELIDAEQVIMEYAAPLTKECSVDVAKESIYGFERNCKLNKITANDFAQNPYIKNIKIKDCYVDDVYLNNIGTYLADITYINSSRKRDPKTLTTIYDFCYFDEPIRYPSIGIIKPDMPFGINYDKWMGVEPGEINTFASFIAEAKGNVLLMGCGLAYVAYMLSIKKDVETVTIVELNPKIIEMFQRNLKPQMNDKIKIVQGDAIHFLENEDLSKYQYCSVDIWHSALDMLPIYLKCLLAEPRHPHTKFHYWLEGDLHIGMENLWIDSLNSFLTDNLPDFYPKIFTDILANQNIKTIEDVRNFILADKRSIIKQWALSNPDEAYNMDIEKEIAKKLKLY